MSGAGRAEPRRVGAHARAATHSCSQRVRFLTGAGLCGPPGQPLCISGKEVDKWLLWSACPRGPPRLPVESLGSEHSALPARPSRSPDTEEAPQEALLAPTTQVHPCHSRREKTSELDRNEHGAVVPKYRTHVSRECKNVI